MGDFKVFDYMEEFEFEQVVHFHDKTTGLKGITVIHNTQLGPSLGGTRLWNYKSEEEAEEDCLRLARGMTYKAAAAGLNLGGGKTVLLGTPDLKNEAYMRALGRFVQSLNGRYITAEDINITTKDLGFVNMETDHVVGLEGKSGNPSPKTALGAFYGIRAALKHKHGDDTISKYTFAVQGTGQTGYFLTKLLLEHGAKKVYFTEINQTYIDRMNKEHPEVEFIKPENYFSADVDVLSTCALGGLLNDETIPQIKAKIVAGTANNILKDENVHGDMLKDRGILYAPDFVINAGGLINVAHEIIGYNEQAADSDIALIYDRLMEIFKIADEQNIHTQKAAMIFAQNRIDQVSKVRSNYINR